MENFVIDIPFYLFKKIFSHLFKTLPNNPFFDKEIKKLDNGLDTYLTLHHSSYNILLQFGLVCKHWALNLLPRILNLYPSIRIVDNYSFKIFINLLTNGLIKSNNINNNNNLKEIEIKRLYFDNFNFKSSNSNSNKYILESIKVETVYFDTCLFDRNEIFTLLCNPNVKEIKFDRSNFSPSNLDAISKEVVSCKGKRLLHLELSAFYIRGDLNGKFNLMKSLSHPNAQLSSLVVFARDGQKINLSDIFTVFEYSQLDLFHLEGFSIINDTPDYDSFSQLFSSSQIKLNMSKLRRLKLNSIRIAYQDLQSTVFNLILSLFFTNLVELEMNSFDFSSLTRDLVKYLNMITPTLEVLNLASSKISDFHFKSFLDVIESGMGNLKSLNVSGLNSSNISISSSISNRFESIEFNSVKYDPYILDSISKKTGGKLLKIAIRNLWPDLDLIVLNIFPNLFNNNPMLDTLDLNMKDTGKGVCTNLFRALANNLSLKNLSICGPSESFDDISEMCRLIRKNQSIEHFKFRNYEITNSTLDFLKAIDTRDGTISIVLEIADVKVESLDSLYDFIRDSTHVFTLDLSEPNGNIIYNLEILLDSVTLCNTLHILYLHRFSFDRKFAMLNLIKKRKFNVYVEKGNNELTHFEININQNLFNEDTEDYWYGFNSKRICIIKRL